MPLEEVLKKLREECFLESEAKITVASTAGKENLAVSPGGSIVYSKEAMEHLRKVSVIVYLKATLPIPGKRIGGIPRGIVGSKKGH